MIVLRRGFFIGISQLSFCSCRSIWWHNPCAVVVAVTLLIQVLLSIVSDLDNFYCMAMSFSEAAPAKSRLVYGKDDALFGAIEKQQGDKPFGNFLDAGTGKHSLRWVGTLGEKGMTKFTAITADETMRRNVQQEADELEISHLGEIIIGNWFGESPIDLEHKEQYDTILADYLIGAMDGFSPYKQDLMIPKLVKLLKPGGRLYIVGLEPLPDEADGPANIICKVRQVRDACILLAGHRCYREYPLEWIHRQLEQNVQLQLTATSQFPILYRHKTILTQINVARSKFKLFPTPELANQMKVVLDGLEQQSLDATNKVGRIKLGFDYVVSAEKIVTSSNEAGDEVQTCIESS